MPDRGSAARRCLRGGPARGQTLADPVRADLRRSGQLQPARARACGRQSVPGRGAVHFAATIPEALLAESFRREVLEFLACERAISQELRERMLDWRHSGFSVHNQVTVGEHDPDGRKMLAGYMVRAPMSLENMTYDPATGTVIYRSMMHLGLKRNFLVMPGAEWLELLCRHIPDRYEHLVRYVGWYSNRAREESAGRRKRTRGCGRAGHRICCPRQDRLGAAHPQGLRSRSIRVPEVQGPYARHRAHR